jgi:hypothetical protein
MPPLTAIDRTWRPNDAVYQLLEQRAIPREFAEDQLPEFILYWQERGQKNHSWGSKFLKHVIHEWRSHEIKQARSSAEKPLTAMSNEWRPSKKASDYLLKAGITKAFIDECTVSFVMYWVERGELHNTWNSKFVQHCQFRDQQAQAAANIHSNGQRMRPLQEELVDRSWAIQPTVYSIDER